MNLFMFKNIGCRKITLRIIMKAKFRAEEDSVFISFRIRVRVGWWGVIICRKGEGLTMGMALIGLNDGTEKLNLEGYQREGGEYMYTIQATGGMEN